MKRHTAYFEGKPVHRFTETMPAPEFPYVFVKVCAECGVRETPAARRHADRSGFAKEV